MKKILAAAVGVAMLAGVTSANAEVVKVGVIANFSGAFAIWGQQFKQSVEAYQKVNGKTVDGHEIQFVYRDTGGADPAKSRQHAEELIMREKVKFLAGFDLTPNALAVAELITEAKVPTVIFNAATSIITRKSPYFVRTSMTLQQYIAPLPTWAATEGKIKTSYTLVSDYAAGYDAEEIFIKNFEKEGGKVIGKDRIPLSVADFAPYIERAGNSGAESIYIFMPAGAPSVAIIREFAKRGLKEKGVKLLAGGEVQELFLPAIGDDVIGTISGMHYTETNTNPENILLKKTLIDLFGKDATPDIGSVGAWDGTKLIYDGVKALGPKLTADQFMEFAKGRKWDSPRGPIMIDPVERDIIQRVYLRRVEKRDGKLVNIDFYTSEMVKDPWKLANPNAK
jgi:branched-chain amino acid transport system substrate-binding protein